MQETGINLTFAMTGASGAIFGQEMLRALESDDRVGKVHFLASENSLRVMAEELGVKGRNGLVEKLLGTRPTKTTQHAEADVGASIASGSYPSAGMIVLPCSMGTLASIANGLADALLHRTGGHSTFRWNRLLRQFQFRFAAAKAQDFLRFLFTHNLLRSISL